VRRRSHSPESYGITHHCLRLAQRHQRILTVVSTKTTTCSHIFFDASKRRVGTKSGTVETLNAGHVGRGLA
jgi:hypothetical protein